MSITFAVDDVPAATRPPRSCALGELVGDVLALGLDRERRVLTPPRTHPLLGAVHAAFAEHRPLVLSPDAIWLTIAQGLARHVRLHAETLRGRPLAPTLAARHEGQKRLTVRHDGPFPTEAEGIARIVDAMRGALAAEIGEGPARLFVCDFSTSTDVERIASEIVLLDAYSPFYDYGVECVCGIPTVTLTGTVEDWQSVGRRIDAMAELVTGSGLPDWPRHLRRIADELVEAAAGTPDRAFFQRIYKPKKAYGTDRVTGWIAWLYPYLGGGGRYDVVNPLLAHAPDQPLPGEDRVRPEGAVGPDWWTGPGIRAQDVPAELGEALFQVDDQVRGTRFDVSLRGGVGCITVEDDGALAPRALWWCEPGAPSIDELAERLGTRGAPSSATRPSGVAELDVLTRRVGPIAIHGDLVRSLEKPIALSLGESLWGTAYFALGDGSLLAVVDAMGSASGRPLWVYVPSASLSEAQHGLRQCTTPLVDVPVAAERLTRFLAHALEHASLPAASGSLLSRLPPALRVPRVPPLPSRPLTPIPDAPLASRTTLELGGRAERLVAAKTEPEIVGALALAESERLPLFVLGGGSNLIVPDEGYAGVVLAIETRGVATMPAMNARGERTIRVTAAAGEPWDDFVALTVQNGWQGLECLSGIPGLVGATPVQNVGAYGQDVSETIFAVGVIDRQSRQALTLSPEECQFAYRDSALKRDPDRYVVTWVCFELRPGVAPALKYAELQRALAQRETPTLAEVRETVISLRKKKSMVLDPFDPNRRSAGSFFTNPIVSSDQAEEVVRRALAAGLVTDAAQVPRWPEAASASGAARVKLAAGWLIEKSGIEKGLRVGHVGVSTAHALALVHHGGGTTAELLALAEHVRDSVRETFGVELEREPVLMR